MQSKGVMPLDKGILNDYIDACKFIEETEEELKKLKKKRKIVHDKVKGSNPEWPYEARSFSIGGAIETVDDVGLIQREEQILQRKKATAEELKLQVEEWMQEIPFRMQRIIKYRFFDRLSWEEAATLMGKKCTGEGIRMEFNRFMKDC